MQGEAADRNLVGSRSRAAAEHAAEWDAGDADATGDKSAERKDAFFRNFLLDWRGDWISLVPYLERKDVEC